MYRADPKHATIIVNEMGLDLGSKELDVPGKKDELIGTDETELGKVESSKFRSIVARANYLAMDRTDIQ